MMERFEDTRKLIAEMAKQDFDRHEAKELAPNEWRCGRPDSGISAFRVICRPGYVIVYGDLGDWILQHSDADSLGWLRRAAGSYDYLLGKVKAGGGEEFYPGDVVAWLEELARENPDEDPEDAHSYAFLLREVREAMSWGNFDRHKWGELVIENGRDTDFCTCGTRFGARMLWLAEAMKWFAAHVDDAAREQRGEP